MCISYALADKFLKDHCVGEVKVIFQPVIPFQSDMPVAPYLVYAERLDPLRQDALYAACRLPRLQRAKRSVGGRQINRGSIVDLSRILTAVDIVPYFGEAADRRLTKFNSMRFSSTFLLNYYVDKCTFHKFNNIT